MGPFLTSFLCSRLMTANEGERWEIVNNEGVCFVNNGDYSLLAVITFIHAQDALFCVAPGTNDAEYKTVRIRGRIRCVRSFVGANADLPFHFRFIFLSI